MAGTAQGAAKARATRNARVQKTQSLGENIEVNVKLQYIVVNRPLNMGDKMLEVGDVVEGAASWPRVEAWVRARRIKPVYVAEED